MILKTIAQSPYTHHATLAAGAYAIGAKALKDNLLARNCAIATIGVCLIQQLILRSNADFEKKFTACSFVSLAAFGFLAYQKASSPTNWLCLGLYVLNLNSLNLKSQHKIPYNRTRTWTLNDLYDQYHKPDKTRLEKANLILPYIPAAIFYFLDISKVTRPLSLPFYALVKQVTTPLRIVQSILVKIMARKIQVYCENKELLQAVKVAVAKNGSDELKKMPIFILFDDGTKSAKDFLTRDILEPAQKLPIESLFLYVTTRNYVKGSKNQPGNLFLKQCVKIIKTQQSRIKKIVHYQNAIQSANQISKISVT